MSYEDANQRQLINQGKATPPPAQQAQPPPEQAQPQAQGSTLPPDRIVQRTGAQPAEIPRPQSTVGQVGVRTPESSPSGSPDMQLQRTTGTYGGPGVSSTLRTPQDAGGPITPTPVTPVRPVPLPVSHNLQGKGPPVGVENQTDYANPAPLTSVWALRAQATQGTHKTNTNPDSFASLENLAMAGYNTLSGAFATEFTLTANAGYRVAHNNQAPPPPQNMGVNVPGIGEVTEAQAAKFAGSTGAYIFPGGAILHGVGDTQESDISRAFDIGVGALPFVPGAGAAVTAVKGASGVAVRAAGGATISAVGTALQGGNPEQVGEAAAFGAVIGAGAPLAMKGISDAADRLAFSTEANPLVKLPGNILDITPGGADEVSAGPVARGVVSAEPTESGALVETPAKAPGIPGATYESPAETDISYLSKAIPKNTMIEGSNPVGESSLERGDIAEQSDLSLQRVNEDIAARNTGDAFANRSAMDASSRITGGEQATGSVKGGIYEPYSDEWTKAVDFSKVGRDPGMTGKVETVMRPTYNEYGTKVGEAPTDFSIIKSDLLPDQEAGLANEMVKTSRLSGLGERTAVLKNNLLQARNAPTSAEFKGETPPDIAKAPGNPVTAEDLELFKQMGEPSQGREPDFMAKYQRGPGAASSAGDNTVTQYELTGERTAFGVEREPITTGAEAGTMTGTEAGVIPTPSLSGTITPLKFGAIVNTGPALGTLTGPKQTVGVTPDQGPVQTPGQTGIGLTKLVPNPPGQDLIVKPGTTPGTFTTPKPRGELEIIPTPPGQTFSVPNPTEQELISIPGLTFPALTATAGKGSSPLRSGSVSPPVLMSNFADMKPGAFGKLGYNYKLLRHDVGDLFNLGGSKKKHKGR